MMLKKPLKPLKLFKPLKKFNFFILSLFFATNVHGFSYPDSEFSDVSEDFEYDKTNQETWKEAHFKISLPSTNLKKISLDQLSIFSVFIDLDGMTINHKDGVSRFWLKTVSVRSENYQYIGIYCDQKEHKIYAYAYKGKIKTLNNPKWKSNKAHYHELAENYICDRNAVQRTKTEINYQIQHEDLFISEEE